MSIGFSEQIKREMSEFGAKASAAVTRAGKKAWQAAVDSTPVLTGNLRFNWKLSNVRRSSYVPKPGNKPKPRVPFFKFRITKDKRVYIYNNTPYAEYVNNGDGPGDRTPKNMIQKSKKVFESELQREMDKIK